MYVDDDDYYDDDDDDYDEINNCHRINAQIPINSRCLAKHAAVTWVTPSGSTWHTLNSLSQHGEPVFYGDDWESISGNHRKPRDVKDVGVSSCHAKFLMVV